MVNPELPYNQLLINWVIKIAAQTWEAGEMFVWGVGVADVIVE